MYSGITQGLYPVVALTRKPGLIDYTVQLSPSLTQNLKPGDSIAVNGVCQTVTHIEDTNVSFQAIQETLNKTTLNELKQGDFVSIERTLRVGDEIGGHEVSGHVYGTGLIHARLQEPGQLTLRIQCDPTWMKYILPKGFIALDGSSLTIGETKPNEGLFYVHLIPETLRLTRFSQKQSGDQVNIEFDHKTKTIVDTVERILKTVPVETLA